MLLPRTLLLETKTPATALCLTSSWTSRQVTITHNQMPSQFFQPNRISVQHLVANPVKPGFQSQSRGQRKNSCEQSQLTNHSEGPSRSVGVINTRIWARIRLSGKAISPFNAQGLNSARKGDRQSQAKGTRARDTRSIKTDTKSFIIPILAPIIEKTEYLGIMGCCIHSKAYAHQPNCKKC